MPEEHNRWRWWIWIICVLAWTAALLAPDPTHSILTGARFGLTLKLIAAKSLHFGVYATLAMLTGWLAAPLRYRFLLVFALMAHATLSELLQHSLPSIGRDGNLLDVAIDNAGVALGVLLTWRWWTNPV